MALRDLTFGLRDAAWERGAQHAVQRDVDLELEAHLALAAEDLESAGCSPDDARRQARQRFGDLDRIRRECYRIRLGGDHAMNVILLVTNLVLVAALIVSLLFARNQQARAEEALRAAMDSRAAAEEAAQESLAAREPVEIVVEIGDVLVTGDRSRDIDFGDRALVQADGNVLLTELGWVPVVGLTRAEVEDLLTRAYADYYPDLTVTVQVLKGD